MRKSKARTLYQSKVGHTVSPLYVLVGAILENLKPLDVSEELILHLEQIEIALRNLHKIMIDALELDLNESVYENLCSRGLVEVNLIGTGLLSVLSSLHSSITNGNEEIRNHIDGIRKITAYISLLYAQDVEQSVHDVNDWSNDRPDTS